LPEKAKDSEDVDNFEVTENKVTENEVLNKDAESNTGEDRDNFEVTENKVTENEVLKREIEFLNGELEKEKDLSEKNLSKLRYLIADFDNYRKQMQKQVESKIEENRGQLFMKILKIYDDCMLALGTLKNGQYDSTVIGGIRGIMTNFESFMKDEGLVEIETMNTPFDPNVHDAIGFVTNELAPDNTIVEVVRKGYLLNNKVLRPSSVILSKRTVTNKDINERDKE
jgi:molecular chaperone GrpE